MSHNFMNFSKTNHVISKSSIKLNTDYLAVDDLMHLKSQQSRKMGNEEDGYPGREN